MGLKSLFCPEKEEKIKFDINSWVNLEFNDIATELAKTVIDYRQKFNLSQKDLADILGCKKSYIVALETGRLDDISIRMLIILWTKLSTSNYNMADDYLTKIHTVTTENYKQLNRRRN